MAIHHPRPERRNDLLRGMTEMAEIMAGAPGFIEAGPWEEVDGGLIVGLSRWTSQEAFLAAAPPGVGTPTADIHQWETRPRQLFHLNSWRQRDAAAMTRGRETGHPTLT